MNPPEGMFGLPPDDPKATEQPVAPEPEEDKAAAAPEEAPTPTPAEGQPEEASDDASDASAEEELTASEQHNKHYQTRYQEVMTYLKENHPDVSDVVKEHVREGSRPEVDPQPRDEQGRFAPKEDKQPTEGTRPAPDFYDDPQAYADYVADQAAARLQARLEQEKEDAALAAAKKQYAGELEKAQQHWLRITQPDGQYQGIPKEVQEAAVKKVERYGINLNALGGPTQFLEALLDNVELLMSKHNQTEKATELAGQASAQVRAALNMRQPGAKGSVTPGKKSPEQEHLDAMLSVGGNSLDNIRK